LPTAVARPEALIVAIEVAELLHVAVELTLLVLPLLYVAVAVNCCVPPTGTLAELGVTATEVTLEEVALRVADPLFPWYVAVKVAWPTVTAVASPDALIVAIETAELFHVAPLETSLVVPSL
jgi:hypothetical protein